MGIFLLVSIIVRLVAFFWSFRVVTRLRTAWTWVLPTVLALMSLRQILTLAMRVQEAGTWSLSAFARFDELPALVVSVIALGAVMFLDRSGGRVKMEGDGLRASERRLRQVIDLVPHHIFAKDREGHILLANRAAAEAYGMTVDEFVGKRHQDLLDDVAVVEQMLAEDRHVIDTGRPRVNPAREVTSQRWGGKRVFYTSKVPFTEAETGQPAVLGIAIDITDLRKAEESLRQAQKMETVGLLAGGLAHDFNNLLTAMLGYTDLARVSLPPDSPALEYLDNLERAAEQAAGLTGSLLTFTHRAPTEKRWVSIADICAESKRLLLRLMPANIRQDWEQPAKDLYVYADPVQLQQVLMNLVINARDAMPDGGTVRVQAHKLEPGVAAPPGGARGGDLLRLEVSDTGTGMTEEVRAHVFEPFYTTKPRERGTGLGLAIAQAIVTDHGGRIEVESEPGAGSTFSIILPLEKPAERELRPAPATIPPAPPDTHVLVVEDDDLVRSLVATVLRDAGFVVEQSRHGVEGFQLANSMPHVHVVVADAELPGLSGIELLKRILAQRPEARGLLVSGRTDDESVREEARRLRCAVLYKPLRMPTLVRAVSSVARGVPISD